MEKTVETARLIDIPRIFDPRGNLSYIQHPESCPFPIERVYWMYDIPTDSFRNGRALKSTTEMILAFSGAFNVSVISPDGHEKVFHLDKSYRALVIPPLHWRKIDNFVTNSVVTVIASSVYDEADYIRDFNEFLNVTSTALR